MVTVKARGSLTEDTKVELEKVEGGRWDEWLVSLFGQDEPIGRLKKAEHTYSPDAAGFHGRIVRFHKQVPHWESSAGRARWDTRQDALRALIVAHRKKEN